MERLELGLRIGEPFMDAVSGMDGLVVTPEGLQDYGLDQLCCLQETTKFSRIMIHRDNTVVPDGPKRQLYCLRQTTKLSPMTRRDNCVVSRRQLFCLCGPHETTFLSLLT